MIGKVIEILEALYRALVVNKNAGVQAQLTGSKAEVLSVKDSQSATTAKAYNRAAGASQLEVYVESGAVRIRTDGAACTETTGEPLGEGWAASWCVAAVSVYYVSNATITVVSR
jgi:type IV secretory pathway TrbL component